MLRGITWLDHLNTDASIIIVKNAASASIAIGGPGAGGVIDMQSEPGRGTTFIMTLPAGMAHPEEQSAPQPKLRAVVGLTDDRTRAMAMAILQMLTFDVAAESTPDHQGVNLWLTDPKRARAEEIHAFLQQDARRRVLVFGKLTQRIPSHQIIELSDDLSPASIRHALQELSRDLAQYRQHRNGEREPSYQGSLR